MIAFKEAYEKVLSHSQTYGMEKVLLASSMGRVLSEDVFADRDFPPFDRSTKDGIAIDYEGIVNGLFEFNIEGVVAAGTPKTKLSNTNNCLEIMTGAVLPENTNTVIMYEDVTIENGKATINKQPNKGQNIHRRGGDEKEGALVLEENTKISASEIGVLAAVGKAEIWVKKLPKITLISTGNELVEVTDTPLPYQIRKSNMHSLYAALSEENVVPQQLHLADDKALIKKELSKAMLKNDVLMLSGGVSMGKYDFIPAVLEELGVKKVFHKVLQRPGKPFWFGLHKESNTVLFSFPGNPVSTFANYHIYFKDWFNKSLGLSIPKIDVVLAQAIMVEGTLTRFIRVKINVVHGKLVAGLVTGNGSGDLTSLAKSDGFIRLEPMAQSYEKGDIVPFVATRRKA